MGVKQHHCPGLNYIKSSGFCVINNYKKNLTTTLDQAEAGVEDVCVGGKEDVCGGGSQLHNENLKFQILAAIFQIY